MIRLHCRSMVAYSLLCARVWLGKFGLVFLFMKKLEKTFLRKLKRSYPVELLARLNWNEILTCSFSSLSSKRPVSSEESPLSGILFLFFSVLRWCADDPSPLTDVLLESLLVSLPALLIALPNKLTIASEGLVAGVSCKVPLPSELERKSDVDP